MRGPHRQGIAAVVVVEEDVEPVVAHRREGSGGEEAGLPLSGAGAGAPEKIGTFEVAPVEAGDHGFFPAVAGERPEAELMGAGEKEMIEDAGAVSFGIDEPHAERAEVEWGGLACGAQMLGEGVDLAVVDPDGIHGGGRSQAVVAGAAPPCISRRRLMRSAVGGWVPKTDAEPAAARGLMMYIGETTRLTGIFFASC